VNINISEASFIFAGENNTLWRETAATTSSQNSAGVKEKDEQ